MTRARAGFAAALAAALVVTGAVSSGAGGAGLPPPRFGQSVDIGLVSGVVMVKPVKGVPFQLGVVDRSIPVGSVIDSTRGVVDLRTAYAPGTTAHGVQDGQFSGAPFTILQRPAQKGLSVLHVVVPRAVAQTCPRLGATRRAAGAHLSSRVLASLHSTAHGAFRTRGRFSAASVRGTVWDTIDRCDGTLTRVRRGTVNVIDFVRHVVVTVTAGHSYLARAA